MLKYVIILNLQIISIAYQEEMTDTGQVVGPLGEGLHSTAIQF